MLLRLSFPAHVGPTRRAFCAVVFQHVLDFPDQKRWLPAVDGGMAIWAHGPQVPDRVQLVLGSYLGDWDKMVHLNVSGRCFSIVGLEVETTSGTTPAMVRRHASRACRFLSYAFTMT